MRLVQVLPAVPAPWQHPAEVQAGAGGVSSMPGIATHPSAAAGGAVHCAAQSSQRPHLCATPPHAGPHARPAASCRAGAGMASMVGVQPAALMHQQLVLQPPSPPTAAWATPTQRLDAYRKVQGGAGGSPQWHCRSMMRRLFHSAHTPARFAARPAARRQPHSCARTGQPAGAGPCTCHNLAASALCSPACLQVMRIFMQGSYDMVRRALRMRHRITSDDARHCRARAYVVPHAGC